MLESTTEVSPTINQPKPLALFGDKRDYLARVEC